MLNLKNKHIRLALKIILVFLLVLLVLSSLLITPVDLTPYKQADYYKKTKANISDIVLKEESSQYFKAGWSKENITPTHPLPIASYGLRNDYEAVHDSLWVRTYVLDNGIVKTAIVTLDLLIFPPEVVSLLKERLPKEFDFNNIYFSATHTHNGAGGWASGLGGRILAGPKNQTYVEKIVKAIVSSIERANSLLEDAEIGFEKYNVSYLVRNRLVKGESVDPWLRVIKIKTISGKVGLITSFSAHPTCLSSKEDKLSGDYPGELVRLLEKHKTVNFASFIAGAVGSQALHEYGKTNYELLEFAALKLKDKILQNVDSIMVFKPSHLRSIKIPLELREPHVKIFDGFRLRPVVFYWLLGKSTFHVNTLEIGDLLFVGLPCDFSGSLVSPLDSAASKAGKNLIISSFNGGYMGYITEDKYYNLGKGETREMNWFGPYNGRYFSEIILDIISTVSSDH